MKAILAEFFGTFILMLTILVVVLEGLPYPAIIIGVVLTVLVYITGPISNAHLNPAISIGFWIRKRVPFSQVLTYGSAQIIAAYLAFIAIEPLMHESVPPIPAARGTVPIMIGEVVGTFLLGSVIWFVATLKRTSGNWYYGVSIGAIVALGIILFGELSGAHFNPATVISCVLSGLTAPQEFAIIIAMTIVGSVSSAFVFNALEPIIDRVGT